jgi:hypothetical protein
MTCRYFLPPKGKKGKNQDNWESPTGQKKAPDRQEKAPNSQLFPGQDRSIHGMILFFYI